MPPMAVATVVEDTRGVRRYQVLQTATDVLTVRHDHDPRKRPSRGLATGSRAWPTCCAPMFATMSACACRLNRRRRSRAVGNSDKYWCPRRRLRMSRTDEAILFEAGGGPHSILFQATRLDIWSGLGRLRPFKVVFQGGLSRRSRLPAPGDGQGERPAGRGIAVTLLVAHPMTSSSVLLR